MKRLPLLLAFLAPPTAPPPAPAPPLAITRDERAMLLGFAGRAEAIQLRAQRDLETVAAEQRAYLAKVAARLGLPPSKLVTEYTINVDTLAVEPRPAAK